MPYAELRMDGARETLRGLERLQAAIQQGPRSIGRTLGREGLRVVTKLTPRSAQRGRESGTSRGHPSLAKQWELIEEITAMTMYRARVRNEASLTAEGFAVLASVESGARPHLIAPRSASPRAALSWRQPSQMRFFYGRSRQNLQVSDTFEREKRRGGRVYVAYVFHPGMRPFNMVAMAKRQLQHTAAAMLRAYGTTLGRSYSGFGVSIRSGG